MWSLIPWKKERELSQSNLMSDPFAREFSRIREEFDQLLDRMWSGNSLFSDRLWESRLGLDVEETDTHYVARVEAPGFEVGDFDVKVSGNQLQVSAERKESHDGKNGSSHRYGRLHRLLSLPEGAEMDQIDAQYRNGILELKIPKGQEAQNAKRIEVKAA
jgi:HSP20 family protein